MTEARGTPSEGKEGESKVRTFAWSRGRRYVGDASMSSSLKSQKFAPLLFNSLSVVDPFANPRSHYTSLEEGKSSTL